MSHYKSWSDLNNRLNSFLCDELQGRISYFLTRYHKVHNSYGRAAIRLDGREIAGFTWMDGYKQEWDIHKKWEETGVWDGEDPILKEKWDEGCVYSEMDFLSAATAYLNLSVKESLDSDNYLIRIFAVLDRRLGKRTLQTIADAKEYKAYPTWVRQFYDLRLDSYAAKEMKLNS